MNSLERKSKTWAATPSASEIYCRISEYLLSPSLALGLALLPNLAWGQGAPDLAGERPAVESHLDQADIDSGLVSLKELFARGQVLFDARFNKVDGQGRPASTGTGAPRVPNQPAFIRTSSPEANSCAGCHNQPRSGGGGDFVANVFVLAQALDPVTTSVADTFSNERNTLGMMGSGPIEMLAREMSTELIAIRVAARDEAANTNQAVTRDLVAKGVSFGKITVLPDGRVDPSQIEGVDWDLIIKPFHQKGAVVSLREFTNNALNHHHGIQSVERFGADLDPDQDGVTNEATVGDLTALTIFQAALNTPGTVVPSDPQRRSAVEAGRTLFAQVNCTDCHIPSMELKDRNFSEPNPFNPPGNLGPSGVAKPFSFDMTREGSRPRLEKSAGDGALVRAFTDLKRHNLNDVELNHFNNEKVPQGKLNGFADPAEFTIAPTPRPTNQFLTRKLWDAGNSMPYGHRGDLTTLTEAIHFHGGDARASRDAYFALSVNERSSILEFLRSMQALPDRSRLKTPERRLKRR